MLLFVSIKIILLLRKKTIKYSFVGNSCKSWRRKLLFLSSQHSVIFCYGTLNPLCMLMSSLLHYLIIFLSAHILVYQVMILYFTVLMVTFVEKKNTATKLGMMMHTCFPALGRLRQEDCCELKAVLGHVCVQGQPEL